MKEAAGPLLRRWAGDGKGGFSFFCPGCNEGHTIQTAPTIWTFDGNLEAPTFAPSISLKNGHYCSTYKLGEPCWCSFNQKRIAEGKEPSRFQCKVCHSFVEKGAIRFLSDCTHSLANKTVPLPPFPENYG